MEIEEVEITINKTGKVIIEVKGVRGSACEDITHELEEALGEVQERIYKTDYYQSQKSLPPLQEKNCEKNQ
ncbi:MAG: hypothetical protein A4E27_01459 [Methanobacterium sp. PtaU1.Bin242]|nr:MAG: hypothetical protein A4E27_01459 [Methanobacterium sp. PtaU1.Bin242]